MNRATALNIAGEIAWHDWNMGASSRQCRGCPSHGALDGAGLALHTSAAPPLPLLPRLLYADERVKGGSGSAVPHQQLHTYIIKTPLRYRTPVCDTPTVQNTYQVSCNRQNKTFSSLQMHNNTSVPTKNFFKATRNTFVMFGCVRATLLN